MSREAGDCKAACSYVGLSDRLSTRQLQSRATFLQLSMISSAQAIVKLAENFNGADLRNICTEAGMFAIRDERDYVVHEDFMKAARKLNEAKKLESSSTYDSSFGDGGKT
jgi:ATP-dependent 26S proteasome regulatory subunit